MTEGGSSGYQSGALLGNQPIHCGWKHSSTDRGSYKEKRLLLGLPSEVQGQGLLSGGDVLAGPVPRQYRAAQGELHVQNSVMGSFPEGLHLILVTSQGSPSTPGGSTLSS